MVFFDFKLNSTKSQNNVRLLTSYFGWQRILFESLSFPLSSKLQSFISCFTVFFWLANDLELYPYIIQLLSTFHIHHLRFEPAGWKSLNQTILFYYRTQLKKTSTPNLLNLELVYDLLMTICDELITLSSTSLHMVWKKSSQSYSLTFFIRVQWPKRKPCSNSKPIWWHLLWLLKIFSSTLLFHF